MPIRRLKDKLINPVTWPELTVILLLRLAALCSFLLLLSILMPGDSIAFYAFMAFAFIITIPYSLWLRNQERIRQFAPLQFTVDLILVSGLVYYTGGLQSDLNLLFPLVILSAGIIAPPKQTVQITVLSILVYLILSWLMISGLLVPVGRPVEPGPFQAGPSVLIRVFVFIFFGIASAYVSRRCSYINRKEEQFRTLTEIIFRNVRAGLLLLDERDRILMANTRACELLGQSTADLKNRPVTALMRAQSGEDHEHISPSVFFQKANGETFPVTYETSSFHLPAEAVGLGGKTRSEVKASLMVFTDISLLMKMQEEMKEIERMKAAADMAAEVAHEIRTPLTAISGAVQLLEHLDRQQDGTPSELAERDKKELLHQIFLQSARIDKVIQHFLDYAEFSKSDLVKLIELDVQPEPKTAD